METHSRVMLTSLGAGVVFALLFLTARAPAADLFAYWALEETDPGDGAEDLGPNEIEGIYLSGVDPDVDGAPGFGSGAEFDGTIDGSIDLGPDNPLGELLSDFSIVAWIFPTDLTGKNRIIGSLQFQGWGFGPVGNNILEVTTFGVLDYRVNVDIPQDEWTHVAVVLDENADATFYVNGELIGTVLAGGPASPSFDNFYIGRASNAAEYFTGRIDEVAVFEGSLTEDEVIDIMEEGVLGEGATCFVVRTLSTDAYEPGDTVEVTLRASNITGATTITDTFPDGWTVSDAGGGTVAGNTIQFTVDANGDVSYQVTAPADLCEQVTFSGTYTGACEGDVGGASDVRCITTGPMGLFGYWPLEEEDPADPAEDLGPNGIDGTYLTGVTPGEDGAPGFGLGALFDGTIDGVIDLGSDNPLGTLTNDFTVVAWIYPTALTGKNRIIGSATPGGWGFGPVNNNTLQVTTFGVKDYNASVDIPQDQWTHVAVVLDANSDATFYVNGVNVGTDPAGGPASPTGNTFYIGRASNAAEYFTGRIDEVAVFKASLTEDDIIDIMEEGVLGEGGTCFVTRTLSTARFEPGDTVEVTLRVGNLTGPTTITETFPDGWTVANDGGGTVAGNTIAFSVDTGGEISYQLTAPGDVCEDVTLSGTYSGAGGCEGDVIGQTALVCVRIELFAYWPLEEEDPADPAEDLGPNGIDGTYLLGVTPGEDGAPGFGGGALFDGTVDGSIDLGPDNPLGTLTNDFSIVAWIFPTDLTGKNRIIGSATPGGWGFGPVNNNILEITTFAVKDYDVSVDIPQDEWTHVAVVLDANADATFYVNGVNVGSSPAGGPASPTSNNFYIGRATATAPEYFTGVLDEVAVFKGSLTEDHIIDIMEEGVLPEGPTEPEFRRGDTTGDGKLDLTDGVNTLDFLFSGGAEPGCEDAADTDDDGSIAITDAIATFSYLFAGGEAPASPGPDNCGPDPTDDGLTCVDYPACP